MKPEVEYYIEDTEDKKKGVYRVGGDPYYASWSVLKRKWISPDYLDDEDMEKIFLMHDGVDSVTEEEAEKQIAINNGK